MLTAIIVIAVILALAIVTILVLAAMKPDTFRVERTASINAPPETIFPLINDYKKWVQWSPYEHRDLNMKRTYGAVTEGKGATYAWEGDKNVGSGRMEIVDTTPPSKIVIKLDFLTPFRATNTAEFTIAQGSASTLTNVTWAMFGPCPFMARIMHTVMNIDRMVGNDFAAGLASMKAVAERQAANAA